MIRVKKQGQFYVIMIGMLLLFVIFAFVQQPPGDIVDGFTRIITARSVLLTDYIKIGGMGGAFINVAIISFITIVRFSRLKITPNGSTIMSLFLTFGFALFGKNILNMIPITIGVWAYSKMKRKPYSDYFTIGLLAATISPIISEIIFLDVFSLPINVFIGVASGIISGFLFPMISDSVIKIQNGYNLYNMGFVGGLLATFFIAILLSIGIDIVPEYHVSGGNNVILSILMFAVSLFLIVCGLVFGERKRLKSDMQTIMKCHGTLTTDFYSMIGANVYINMGVLCLLGTLLVLLIGAELNGPTIAGILTLTGFGAYGKHMKNVTPLLLGAVISTLINQWDHTYTPNVLGILFSTGLAPIAGKYGPVWGVITGFLHVCVLHHIGGLCNGLNLYNNGFAAGFVVILMVPIIEGIGRFRAKNG